MPIADASYTSYLLRLWRAQREDGHTWIASVQSTATGEQRRFPDLEVLIQFLREEFGGCEQGQEPPPEAQATETTTVP